MPAGYEPATVPLYEGRPAVEDAYAQAERDGQPFFGVESYDEGYSITYDLLPAGYALAPPTQKEVKLRLTTEIEAVVADDGLPTTEVSKSVSASLGSIATFEREESARRVAAAVSDLVLDEANWVEPQRPQSPQGDRRN